MNQMITNLEKEGLDMNNVTCWSSRPKRNIAPPPKTYWEEYVETDTWYTRKLLEDVPDDEMEAACFDEHFTDDEGEEGDSEEESESEEDEDLDYQDDELSESSSTYNSKDGSERDSVSSTDSKEA